MSKSLRKKKCRFKGCKNTESPDYNLMIEGKRIPVCEKHGEYTAQRMLEEDGATVTTRIGRGCT
jgi:hypothetical protein